jgi:hypothetical protein
MTIGKITASQQDLVYVKVRPEDGTFMETHNGSSRFYTTVNQSIGQVFTSPRWFGRIKVKVLISMAGTARFIIYDSPSKNRTIYEKEVFFTTLDYQVIHVAFDPLPPGTYYYEISNGSFIGDVRVSMVTDSTLHGAYIDASPASLDIESKLMFVIDSPEERPVAQVGDEVDNGATTVQTGSPLGNIIRAGLERNISREGDALANGGTILTASWFVELGD